MSFNKSIRVFLYISAVYINVSLTIRNYREYIGGQCRWFLGGGGIYFLLFYDGNVMVYIESNYVDFSCFSLTCQLFTPELCHQEKKKDFLGNQYNLTM